MHLVFFLRPHCLCGHVFLCSRVPLSLLVLAFLIVIGVAPERVYAEAFRILPQSATAMGQGGAFTAQVMTPLLSITIPQA